MASLNEGRKKSNFGTKSSVGNVDIETSRSKVQDPANTTVNPKKGPPKGGGQGFSISKDSAARYAGNPDKVQQALTADDIRSRPGAETTPKNAAGNILSGGRKPSSGEETVGTGAKPGRGQRYRQTRPSDVKSTGIGTRTKSVPIPKTTVVKQSEVSKRAERFRQSFGTPTGANPLTGAPTYKPISTTSDLPKGVGGRAPSSRQYGKVKISDLTSTAKPTKAVAAPTKTKVKLPKLTVTTLPAQPSTTIRRRSGNAGPSSKLNAGKFTPPKSTTRSVTTSKEPTLDLGRKSQVKTRTGSVSYKPEKYKVSSKYGALSVAGDAVYGGVVGYDAYQKAKARGQTDAYAYKQAAAQGGTVATASAAGGAFGRKLGSKAPGWTKMIAAPVGDILGSSIGGYVAQTASPGIVGASKSDKKWMQWANRSVQQGTPAQSATSKSGNKAIVRDAKGKERVGYRAYKDGKAVYKHGNDPSSLQYTSSNPLERIGRTVGSGGLGPVSDLVKGYYSRKDAATRTANVAAQRSRANK